MVGAHRTQLYSVAAIVLFILSWAFLSRNADPTLLPSPMLTWKTFVELVGNGTLESSISISLWRVLSGWILGSVIAIPLGILASFSAVDVSWGQMTTLSVLAILPAIIISAFLNRYFVQGLTMGATKG